MEIHEVKITPSYEEDMMVTQSHIISYEDTKELEDKINTWLFKEATQLHNFNIKDIKFLRTGAEYSILIIYEYLTRIIRKEEKSV